MFRMILAAMMIAAMVGMLPGVLLPVAAQSPSAIRSFSATSVDPGEQVTVNIEVANYGPFGSVTETLPEGFTYVSSTHGSVTHPVDDNSQMIRFTLFGDSSVTYTVTASSVAGDHSFSGQLGDSDRMAHPVGGATDVAVEQPVPSGPSAVRTFDATSVTPGGQVTVTITVADFGGFGRVTEMLPDGFAYVGSSLDDSQVVEEGQTVKFTLQGENSFTYTVNASSVSGDHSFSGQLRDSDRMDHTVGGDSSVTVQQPEGESSRSFSRSGVTPGGQVTVTINPGEYGGFGRVTETLPDGFAYVGSSLDDFQVTELDGNMVRFTLQGDTSFTYTVTASGLVGAHTFYGVLRDSDLNDTSIGGASRITVSRPPRPAPTPSTPSAMPGDDDPCLDSLSVDGAVSGTWSSGCESQVSDRGYARYYSFTLSEGSDVTVSLESSTDPYLYLRSGTAKSGDFLHENDDLDPGTDTNSRIEATLGAGTYTIEATTYSAGDAGSFTLTVNGLGAGGTMPGDDSCLDSLSVDGAVSGTWSSGCESQVTDRGYARYYSFTLSEGSDVTISLESSTDPYLYLRAGEAKSGTAAHENDDLDPGTDTNSRIEATLGAGTYTIEATTYSAGETGSFTLTVSGLGGGAVADPSDDTCLDSLSVDGAVSGTWSSGCESQVTDRGYARYYSFTLSEGSDVTISLESSTDPYLYLRAGEAKSGTAAHENDDLDPGTDTNSRIEATLGAGTYTIEATTYSAGETGSFTLKVGGL